MKKRIKTLDLVQTAIGSVLIAICSWITIPSVVPFTMQTFAVFCVLSMLGGKKGTVSVILYILLGTFGLPVFAGFTGGPGILVGVTGGYIVGFILMGLSFWAGERLFGSAFPVPVISMLIGLFLCYAFGTGWFMLVYTRQSGAIGLGTALAMCVLPFILPDLIKIALALTISARIRNHLNL